MQDDYFFNIVSICFLYSNLHQMKMQKIQMVFPNRRYSISKFSWTCDKVAFGTSCQKWFSLEKWFVVCAVDLFLHPIDRKCRTVAALLRISLIICSGTRIKNSFEKKVILVESRFPYVKGCCVEKVSKKFLLLMFALLTFVEIVFFF